MAIAPAALALFPALVGCAAAISLGGCERRISSENIDAANQLQDSAQRKPQKSTGVSEGMTEKEVESILGQPELRRAGKSVKMSQPVDISTMTYVYKQDGQDIELSFLDGKLQGRIPKFGETIDAKAPLHMLQKEAAEQRGANGEPEKPGPAATPKAPETPPGPGAKAPEPQSAQPPKQQP